MAGVEIGRVDDIHLTNNQVLVMMKVRPKADVKTDSIATIKFTGLMGQNFVAIELRHASRRDLEGQSVHRHRRAARPQRHHAED